MGAVDEVLLAYSPVGASKLARMMALPRRVRLSVALDSREALAGLREAARQAGRTVGGAGGTGPGDAPRGRAGAGGGA
jgi:D-serine deaminase-like pyridoxal phosphate-dependent protein